MKVLITSAPIYFVVLQIEFDVVGYKLAVSNYVTLLILAFQIESSSLPEVK
ncbi:hypothetical protein M8998_12910 [Sphingobacterium sp. lm-10]|uniref:hypothetical protein n=1 Tax=Sphingobacterium sp. lm-10 TaxID=2944904 RepID=UPI0020204107|nr:hypothetical protein [Sphingobacterium sp. lm-10]MCL7988843.1 hypothetical protein [Sphingobacterium sp. lm-10]